MAEITRRSAGEAGWAYDVGGKTYYTEAEAQRAASQASAQTNTATQSNTQSAPTADKVVITRFADGKAGILFPGGGIQSSSEVGEDYVKKLKQAYGDRVSDIVDSSMTLEEAKAVQQGVRQEYRDAAVNYADRGSGYYANSATEEGYSVEDIQKYIDSSANKQGPGFQSVDEYINTRLERDERLVKDYFGDAWDTMTTKQKLAAGELYYQGNGDTGRTNGLSAKDVDWVLNKANDFKGIVTSPNAQAISTGFDQTLDIIKKVTQPQTTVQQPTSGIQVPVQQLPPITAGPGEFVPVQPKPQIVTQQVQPTQYFNQSFQADPSLDQRAGTFAKPLQTAGLSAVPTTVSYKTHSAGTTGLIDPTLVVPTLGSTGTQQVIYGNELGQTLTVTEVNGAPLTYVPPGFTRKGTPQEVAQQEATGQTAVGNTGTTASTTMSRGGAVGFASGGQASKVLEAKYRIATMNGYNGPKTNSSLDAFANASPAMSAKFNAIGAALAKGGYMSKGYDGGGLEDGSTAFSLAPGTTVGQTTTDPTTGTTYKWNGSAWEVQGSTTPVEQDPFQQMQSNLVSQTMQPQQANVQFLEPTAGQFIPVDAGQALPIAPFAEAATAQTVQQAELPTTAPAASMQAAAVTPEVQQLTAQTQAAQGTVSEQAQVQAAQQQGTSVAGMQAAQGVATMVDSPAAREIQQGELISGVANAEKAAVFNEQIQAAEATPSKQATVQGQLETLMAQFEGGNRPAWAAASMRNAMSTLAARGLGASSMAGQAVIQAAMEAALPIAQMDAQVQAQFESQNLSNRQQRAMLAAQQRAEFLGMEFTQEFQARVQNSARIGDIANMNFTAEQQIALENSRAANTMNLNNLSNRQAMVMAEVAALAQLDMANLNNRQQAAVQNAQNFMQMDMTNLGNMQQTALFNAQQNIQALFTDQAAENASRQFNASSENQTNQFFANLSNQTAQFNASQQNAMDQFNINSVNALREFNSNLQQQRDMFNAQNGLVIAQANAQWRQSLDTINTTTLNQSNSDFAKTINALTSTNLDQIWQRERDLMSFAFTSSENSMDRALKIILGDKQLESVRLQLDAQEKAAKGALFTRFLFGSGGAGGGGLLGKLVPGLGL